MLVIPRNALNATGWAASCGFLKTERQQALNVQLYIAKRAVLIQDLAP